MIKQGNHIILNLILLLFFSQTAHAYVYCETKVTEIYPHISNGNVFFKFEDGTAIEGTSDQDGIDRNMSVALAALTADKKVKIVLNDGEVCGSNSHKNWSYIVAIQ